VGLCALVCSAVFGGTPALALRTHTYRSQFDGSLTPQGSFIAQGVAADQTTGDVYVADSAHGVVDVFNAAGGYLSQLTQADGVTPFVFGDPWGIAVDQANGDVYVADPGDGVVDIFNAAGVYQSNLDSGLSRGVAVNDSTGEVYAAESNTDMVYVFSSSGSLLSRWSGAETPAGSFGEQYVYVGADQSSGDVYVSDTGAGLVDKFDSAGSYLSELMQFDGTKPFEFAGFGYPLWISTDSAGNVYVVNPEAVEEFNASSILVGETRSTPSGPLANLTAAAVGAGGALYVAEEKGSSSVIDVFEAATSTILPEVKEESFSKVGSFDALLSSRINPRGLAATCYFEYGTTSAYGSSTPKQAVGASLETVDVQAQLPENLVPGTEYHFRVVLENEGGREPGPDTTFRTFPKGALGLPDGRVFERVSPVEDGQAEPYTPAVYTNTGLPRAEGIFTEYAFAVSTEGNAIVYQSAATIGGASEANADLARRSAGGDWQQASIEPPGKARVRYLAFSGDLATGILESSSETGLEYGLPPLSPEAPGGGVRIPYKHVLGSESYQPFITTAASIHRGEHLTVNYAGASSDLSQVFFSANDALIPGAIEGEPNGAGYYHAENLYESIDGRLSLVNVLPDGSSVSEATFGAPCVAYEGDRFCLEHAEGLSAFEQREGAASADLSRVVSANGLRVFWTDLKNGNLYVREDPASSDAKTVQINAGVAGSARFWTASADGSKVFFTKGKRYLTGQADGELYEYDLEDGQTTDLTPGVEVASVIGASESGEYLYYVDSSYKLYLWHDGVATFIAALSGADGGEEAGTPIRPYAQPAGDWYTSLGERTAQVTPNGGALEFMSNGNLPAVGYPHGVPSERLEEVYVYEAEDGGKLFCVSCSPSGESPPLGDYSAAAFVPVSWQGTYQPKVISSDGGRVFFDSAEPLVSQDTNGKLDVYEWERDGTGSCGESMGCIYLLSGGQSGSSSWLLGASASGDDVFLASRAPLVAGDPYDAFAVYDARVGGVQPPTPPACSGTGCQGVPPAPPIFATPASTTFAGVGNFPAPSGSNAGKQKPKPRSKSGPSGRARKLARALKACQKQRGHARVLCRARAHKGYTARAGAGKSSIRVGR
jgi:DNA-binding beta-propeller fold protein YncE